MVGIIVSTIASNPVRKSPRISGLIPAKYLAVRTASVLPITSIGMPHTYGTWMHSYGGLDTYGLTRTGRWKDPDSVDRYKPHRGELGSAPSDRLPVAKNRKANR